jgi:hypothetical protein
VLSRDSETKVFAVQVPPRPAVVDRREEPRTTQFTGEKVELNQDWAEIVDLSSTGVRVLTLAVLAAGDVARVKIGPLKVNQLAWVLEVTPESLDGRQGSIVRLRFLDPLPPLDIPTAD